MKQALLFVVRYLSAIVLAAAGSAYGTEFFVAPDGKAAGDGSKEKPWDLATAFSHPEAVKPGDTIWLNGGTYKGTFTSRLKGEEGSPITVRQFPGQRAVIDCRTQKGEVAMFFVEGAWTNFWGVEVTCSDTKRVTDISGSAPGDINRGGISCQGSHIKFINMVIHDTAGGFGFWSGGEGGEIYGCIIYNNGWKGPDRGHGHAIYAQNQNGTKRLVDNIMFNQFGYGIHVYGSSRAFLKGFHIEGNISFNNGSLNGGDVRTPNIHVGGGSPAERITVTNNYTYHSTLTDTTVRLGYSAVNEDLVVTNNCFVGHSHFQDWRKLVVTNNTFAGTGALMTLEIPKGVELSSVACDNNTYLSGEAEWTPLRVMIAGKSAANGWQEWHEKLGLDKNGRYVKGRPTGVDVFVRPNKYEPGRAHIIVYNWDKKDAVEVNLNGVLKTGQKYSIVSAQNYFSEPVLSGTYHGQPVRLPMKQIDPVRPIGMDDYQPPLTGPEFDVFVVLLVE